VFEGRFSEILIIFVLALIVLGPEKLPRVVTELGRWVGRARSMARQFREQLEEEVQLEEARRTQRTPPPAEPAVNETPPAATDFPNTHHEPAGTDFPNTHHAEPTGAHAAATGAQNADERGT
jgi:sec-independent protein translocase protein TatB